MLELYVKQQSKTINQKLRKGEKNKKEQRRSGRLLIGWMDESGNVYIFILSIDRNELIFTSIKSYESFECFDGELLQNARKIIKIDEQNLLLF